MLKNKENLKHFQRFFNKIKEKNVRNALKFLQKFLLICFKSALKECLLGNAVSPVRLVCPVQFKPESFTQSCISSDKKENGNL
jgi:hypothetical protein